MSIEKAQIIALTLDAQAADLDLVAKPLLAQAASHQGARDILGLLANNLSIVMTKAEEEIGADENLGKEAKVVALRHIGRAMTRITTTISEMAKNQQNLIFEVNGRAKMATDLAETFRKRAKLEVAQAKVREESDAAARESSMQAQMDAAHEMPKKAGKKNGKRATS